MSNLDKLRKEILSTEKGKKPHKGRLNVLLFYPNSYEVAITSLAYHRIFEIINRVEDVGTLRCFLEGQEEKKILSLDRDFNLSNVDIVAFFLSYEMDFFNVVKALRLLNMPILSTERKDNYPIIIGGGIAVTENPEPVADFFDVLFIGEAEDSLKKFLKLFFEFREREDILEEASKIDGIYVPEKFSFEYYPDGTLKSITGGTVKKGFYKNFTSDFSQSLFMTEKGGFGNTFLIEMTRGCPASCRFCISRTLYSPVRFSDKEKVKEIINREKDAKRFGLLGASVSFHPAIKEIMDFLLVKGKSFSISSLRAEKLDEEFLELIKKGGSRSITIAPEAGTDNLRKKIKKGITFEDIERTVILSLNKEFEGLKLYFMIGLPFETTDDVKEILRLADVLKQIEKGYKKHFKKISFNITPFIPKPFTPLQWAALENPKKITEKINFLRKGLVTKGINVLYDKPKWAYLEALLSRGDRRVKNVLLKGDDSDKIDEKKLNKDFYTRRERSEKEKFPWDFIDIGIDKNVFYKEWINLKANQ